MDYKTLFPVLEMGFSILDIRMLSSSISITVELQRMAEM